MPISTAKVSLTPSMGPPHQNCNLELMRSTLTHFEGLLKQLIKKQVPQAPARAWARFAELSSDNQIGIIRGLQEQSRFVAGALEKQIDGFDESAMLNYAMGQLFLLSDSGYVSNFMTQINPGDVIEVANKDYIQVYRSYSCFTLCNYSILELTTYPWFELYERSSLVTKQLCETVEKVLEGRLSYSEWENVPEYTLRELMTEQECIFAMKEKYIVKLVSAITGETYVLTLKTVREVGSENTARGNMRFL